MINQNSKTQIQNRINAATGATTLNDLLLLRKAAEGLCCDETNLDTLITAALNAQDGTTPITQVFAGKVAAGLRGRVAYQTPIAVKAGDELFIDALGKVKTEKYPMRGAVALTNVPVDTSMLGELAVAAKGYIHGGRIQAGQASASAILTLSDGNLLYLFPGRGNTLNQLMHASVIAPDEITVISTHQLTPMVNGSDYSNGSSMVGVYEVSANVFRIYYTTGDSGSTSAKAIRYITLTYNTGTKALSSAAGSTVVVGTASGDYAANVSLKQGDRYVLVGVNSSGTQFCLDMQASTVVTYTGVTTMSNFTEFDMSVPGSEYAYALNGSTPSLMKAGADSKLALPANLTTDGCFGSTWLVRLIGPREFLALKAGNPVKLVKFSNDWLAATIYTVAGVTPAEVTTAGAGRALVLKADNNRYFVKTHANEPMFSFLWDGASAPTAIDLSAGWLSTTPVVTYFRARLPVLTSNDRLTYAIISGKTIPDATQAYSEYMYSYFTFDAAELTGYTPGKLGMARGDAAINGLTELELSDEATLTSTASAPLRAELVGKNGLLCTLQRDRFATMQVVNEQNSTSTMTVGNFPSAAAEYSRKVNSTVAGVSRTLGPGGALLSSARVSLSVQANGASAQASACNVTTLSVEGHRYFNSGVSSGTAVAAALIETDKPVLVSFGGRTANILWEREL